MVLWCAKDGSVVLKAHRSCVSSSPGLRAPLYDYLALESGLRMVTFVVLLFSDICSLLGIYAMNAFSDVAVFFVPFFRSRYFIYIDALSLKLGDVLVLEERCKVIILYSIMDSRFASLQQVLLASFLYFDLFSCWNAVSSLNCLEEENSKRGFCDIYLHSSR